MNDYKEFVTINATMNDYKEFVTTNAAKINEIVAATSCAKDEAIAVLARHGSVSAAIPAVLALQAQWKAEWARLIARS